MNRIALWAGLVCLVPAVVQALSSDRNLPIVIDADEFEIDEPRRSSRYRGNVQLTQGSLVVRADEIVVRTNASRDVERLTARGRPTTFSQQLDDGGTVRGEALTIDYDAQQQRLLLEGQARLWRDKDEVSGHTIEYLLDTERVKAQGTRDRSGRVKIILHPAAGNEASKGD